MVDIKPHDITISDHGKFMIRRLASMLASQLEADGIAVEGVTLKLNPRCLEDERPGDLVMEPIQIVAIRDLPKPGLCSEVVIPINRVLPEAAHA